MGDGSEEDKKENGMPTLAETDTGERESRREVADDGDNASDGAKEVVESAEMDISPPPPPLDPVEGEMKPVSPGGDAPPSLPPLPSGGGKRPPNDDFQQMDMDMDSD